MHTAFQKKRKYLQLYYRFVSDGTIDWPLTLGQVKNKTPILLLYTNECEVVERLFISLSTKRGVASQIVNITAADDEHKIKAILQKAITSVSSIHYVSLSCRVSRVYVIWYGSHLTPCADDL